MQVPNYTVQQVGELSCFMLLGALEASLGAACRPNMELCNYPVLYSASLPALDYAGCPKAFATKPLINAANGLLITDSNARMPRLRLPGIDKVRLKLACPADW